MFFQDSCQTAVAPQFIQSLVECGEQLILPAGFGRKCDIEISLRQRRRHEFQPADQMWTLPHHQIGRSVLVDKRKLNSVPFELVEVLQIFHGNVFHKKLRVLEGRQRHAAADHAEAI